MKALVLGGAGFIGAHLVSRLLDLGHEVAILDVRQSSLPSVVSFVGQHEEPELLQRALMGRNVVFHALSTTVPATSNANIEFDITSNLISMIRLLDEMRSQEIDRIVYLSSGGAVYGNPTTYPIAEDHPLNPISSYGVIKVAVEKYLFIHQELYGLRPLIIRPSNAYGPGQNILKPQGVIGHFLASATSGRPLQVWGDGSVRRDYLYISDLIDLIVQATEQKEVGIYNAGSGRDSSVIEIVEIIKSLLIADVRVEHKSAQSCDVERVRLDISKAESVLGWKPTVELNEGIQKHLESLGGHTK